MKFAQIAAGTAAFILLAAQSATAQPMPAQPPPPQLAPPEPPGQPGPGQPGPPPPGGPPPEVAITNVNLRQGPGTNYTVITTIPAGAPVEVGNCQGQWCQVSFQGQNGYVIATGIGQGGAGPPQGGPPPPPPGYYPPPTGYYPPPYYGPYPYYGYGHYYRRRYY